MRRHTLILATVALLCSIPSLCGQVASAKSTDHAYSTGSISLLKASGASGGAVFDLEFYAAGDIYPF